LINIYAPNKDKDSFNFFADLLTRLKNENLDEEENIIVGGDFNCPLNTILDKKGGILMPMMTRKPWKRARRSSELTACAM